MKKLSILFVLTLLLTLFAAINVSAATVATETEGNDSAAVANVIANGQIRGDLSQGNDVDFYKFTADKDYFELTFGLANKYDFESVNDGWAVTIYDYNQDMKELFFCRTTSSFTTPRMPISGTIYIKVETAVQYSWEKHPIEVPYQISYTNTADSSWESEYNDTSKNANAISANKVYHGSLQSAADVDWFKSTSADYFNMTLKANGEIDTTYAVNDGWTVSVYDSALTCLTSFDVTTAGTSINFPVTGTVYVKVESAANYNWEVAPDHFYYDLKVTSVVDGLWENEYNETIATATAITQGKTYTGNLMSSGDVDYYKVKTTSKAFAVVFDVRSDEVGVDSVLDGWNISVYPKDSNTPIDSFTVKSLGTTRSFTLPYAKGNEYYIVVKTGVQYSWERHPVGETYHISVVDASEGKNWEVETGVSGIATATSLKENAIIYGNLYYTDQDYYKINVLSAGTIDIKFNYTDGNDGDGYRVEIVDTKGNQITDAVTINDKKAATISKVEVSKGTYYIVVKSQKENNYPSTEINYNLSYKLTLVKPSIKKIATTTKTLKPSWAKKTDVNGFQVQYATNKSFKSAKTVTINKGSATSTTIKDTTASKVYYVRMRTIVKDGGKDRYSGWSAVIPTANTPTVKKVTGTANTLKVAFAKTSGATKYQVQYATNKNFKDAKTVTGKASATSVTIKKLSASKTYYVRMRVAVKYGDKTYYSGWSETAIGLCNPAVKKITGTKNTLKVSFAKTTGVTNYQIQYATNSSFKSAKTITAKASATSATIKNTSATKTYYVRIRTVVKFEGKTYYSGWSETAIGLSTPTVKKVTPSKNTLKVTWAKTEGATSYQIQYSTNKNFSGAKTITAKSTAATIKNTSAKTTYYVRIRIVAKGSATVYSPWSAAYTVKAK